MDQEQRPTAARHVPVLLERCIQLLTPAVQGPDAVLVDLTLGMGGHSEALLRRFPDLRVVALDRDQQAIALATARLAPFGDRFTAVHAVYDEVLDVVQDRVGRRVVVAGEADSGHPQQRAAAQAQQGAGAQVEQVDAAGGDVLTQVARPDVGAAGPQQVVARDVDQVDLAKCPRPGVVVPQDAVVDLQVHPLLRRLGEPGSGPAPCGVDG